MQGFKEFLLRGNVLELAVAVVIGAAFTGLVTAVVKGLVTPLIGVFGGIPNFAEWVLVVNNSRFAIGDVINALINLLVVAVVLYVFVIQPMTKFNRLAGIEAATKECPDCLSLIPAKAKRCKFCTAVQA